MEYRKLYDMKERPSLLGFGCMRLPLLPGGSRGDIDYPLAERMIDEAVKNGVNYFDTAYGYLDGQSEIFVGKTMKKYPRDSFYLATKLPKSSRSITSIFTCSTASIRRPSTKRS